MHALQLMFEWLTQSNLGIASPLDRWIQEFRSRFGSCRQGRGCVSFCLSLCGGACSFLWQISFPLIPSATKGIASFVLGHDCQRFGFEEPSFLVVGRHCHLCSCHPRFGSLLHRLETINAFANKMGASESLPAPVPDDFGPVDGELDRSRLHDVPWMETLKQMGTELFAVDEQRLDQFLVEASDEELYACRTFYRGYRAYMRIAHPGDQRDFATGLYFVMAQQPRTLLQFYVMLHICWTFGVELYVDATVMGADFVHALVRTYSEEKGKRPEEVHEEEAKVKQRMGPVFREIITSYLAKVLDAVTNPEYQDPQVSSFGVVDQDEVHVWTLKASDGSIELRVTEYGAAIVGCRVHDKDGKWVEVVRSPSSVEGLVEDKRLWRGATIGRYANRIAKSTFVCNGGKTYKVDANERSNHLHGGEQGWFWSLSHYLILLTNNKVGAGKFGRPPRILSMLLEPPLHSLLFRPTEIWDIQVSLLRVWSTLSSEY